jgi:integrase
MPGICMTALRIREKDQAAAKAAAGGSGVQSGLGVHNPGRYAIRAAEPEPSFRDTLHSGRRARRITVREMRHTYATLLAALDVHPRVAVRILRHAQIDVTMNVYQSL